MQLVRSALARVDGSRLQRDLFHLSSDPLPYRKLNVTLPGHAKSTLHEADDFIAGELSAAGYAVEREACRVQAFRFDHTRPKQHAYGRPDPADPWYTAYNLYAKKRGAEKPDEVIVLIAHKDSQSWVDSPGAYDNATGTVAVLELARVLADITTRRSFWFVFCNEEHTPWTSVTVAQEARRRGDDLIAVFNIDSLGGKADADLGRPANVTLYTHDAGKPLADLMAEVNATYRLGLAQSAYRRERPGDDDGSFINAGYLAAVANIGSYPYADAQYHLEGDAPARVDLENVRLSAQASLAAVLHVDQA